MKHQTLIIAWLGLFAFAIQPARAADDEVEDSPAAELESFKVADDLQVNLFASEADGVIKPIQIRFDARGRLWVIGSSVYPQIEPGQIPNDKVLILEDTNHDGKCDKTTVFADGLKLPTGIELTADGAYVGQATQLLRLRDTNGDDKADVREVVLRGFGTGDTHQNINSFLWGPGGELWFCQGLSIRSRVETPWGIVNLSKAGLWRFNPRRMKLEGFYGSENESQNPWGYIFTRWGEPITIAGNSSSHFYPVPGLVPHREDQPIEQIWKSGAGRKCSGGAIVGNAHWPDAWQGAVLLGGYLNNTVWALNLLDHGAGFSLEDRQRPVISSSGTQFRPVDVKFGPDGALYLCDWYNSIIGHYQNSFWDPRRDKVHGRIWRITAKNRPLVKPPVLVGASASELLDQLKSSDMWARHFAKRVLADMSAETVAGALRDWTSQPGRTDLELKEALGVYQSHEVIETELLSRLCNAKDPGARAYAAGVIGMWADRLPDPLAMLRPLVSDENPRVRLHAVISCAYVPRPEAIEVAMIAADHPTDVFLDYALNQVVCSLKPQWVEPFKAGTLKFDNKPARVAALVKWDGTPDTIQSLRALASDKKLDAASRETFLRILADIGSADDLAMIVRLDDAALQAKLLPAVAEAARLRNIKPGGDLFAVVNMLLTRPDEAIRAQALHLAGAWEVAGARDVVEKLAKDPGQGQTIRDAAMSALPGVAGVSSRDVLLSLTDAKNVPVIRASAIAALATIDITAGADCAAQFLSDGASVTASEQLVRALLARDDIAPALVKSMTARPPSADAAKIALRIMSASAARDQELASLLEKASGLNVEMKQVSDAEIAALAAEVRTQGDASHGAEVFLRPEMSCATCHAIAGKGGKIGPDLGSLGTAQTIEFIIGAVLIPNREVKEGYVAHIFATRTGERYQGYIRRDEAKELVIFDIAQNKEVRLAKDQISRRKQLGSPMPSGLTNTLTRAELRDLVKFLSMLGQNAGAAKKL